MKTLVITEKNDFRIQSLIAPLKNIMEVGFLQKYDAAAVSEFRPDIVFSDEVERIPDAYDLKKISGVRPFINLFLFVEPVKQPRYESDISYIGPISDMESSLLDLYKMGYNVRNFFATPSLLPSYSGSIGASDCWHIYKSAKVSPIPRSDVGYRELDIIASDGNPLKYTSKNEFISEAIKGINGKKFKTSMSKASIFAGHTNFDRLSQILIEIGYAAISKKVLQEKKCLV